MTGKGKSAREEESSSDSDDDVDVVAAAPTGYRFFEVDDKWPPAARYERPSTAAVPPISAPHSVTQLQQVLREELADEVYDFAVNKCNGQPWGGYLTAAEVSGDAVINDAGLKIARECVKALWLSAVPEQAPALFKKDDGGEESAAAVRDRILESVHGFEVWVLTGSEGNRCDYHIDFAEFQRYQHNLIFFPLYSATIQVARASMKGGEFTAHTGGLGHYEKIGYKGSHVGGAHKVEEEHMKAGDEGWKRRKGMSGTDIGYAAAGEYHCPVPYTFNQSIIIDGTIPHMSSRVQEISPPGTKRVIIATNVYDNVVGPRVKRFPIHSKQWQRVIKLNNILSKVSKSIAHNAQGNGPVCVFDAVIVRTSAIHAHGKRDSSLASAACADRAGSAAISPRNQPRESAFLVQVAEAEQKGEDAAGRGARERKGEPSKAVGPYGEPLREGPRGGDSSAEEAHVKRQGREGAREDAGGERRVQLTVPLGHTAFSWLPRKRGEGVGVPESHTVFSWRGDTCDE